MTHEPTRQTPPVIPIVPLAARSLSCPISANSPSFPTRSVATSLAHLDCRKPLTLIVAGHTRKPSIGILRWLHSRISNSMVKRMNSPVQAAKVHVRG